MTRTIATIAALLAAPAATLPAAADDVAAEQTRTARRVTDEATPPAALDDSIQPTAAPVRAWDCLVLHHSATASGSVESFDRTHKARGWDGIGYHFVIGNGSGMGDGETVATFRWNEQRDGAHAGQRGFNARGIGICLVGNFTESPPTPKQLAAFDRLVAALNAGLALSEPRPIPHGRVKATQCPGPLFPADRLLPADAALPTIDISAGWLGQLAERSLRRSCDDPTQVAAHPDAEAAPFRAAPSNSPTLPR